MSKQRILQDNKATNDARRKELKTSGLIGVYYDSISNTVGTSTNFKSSFSRMTNRDYLNYSFGVWTKRRRGSSFEYPS